MLEEASEETNGMCDIVGTACFTDAVHAQLGVTQIQGSCAQGGRQHRTNGAATAGVVADDKQLQGNMLAGLLGGLAGNLLQEDNARRVGGIAGVGVNLDHRALVDLWLVIWLILACVVRVDRVGHVSGNKERGGQSLLIGSRQVGILGRG